MLQSYATPEPGLGHSLVSEHEVQPYQAAHCPWPLSLPSQSPAPSHLSLNSSIKTCLSGSKHSSCGCYAQLVSYYRRSCCREPKRTLVESCTGRNRHWAISNCSYICIGTKDRLSAQRATEPETQSSSITRRAPRHVRGVYKAR